MKGSWTDTAMECKDQMNMQTMDAKGKGKRLTSEWMARKVLL